MKLGKKDSLIVVVLVVLVGVLALGGLRGTGKKVPRDDRHQSSYSELKSGRTRAEVELLCATCHGKSSIPLPQGHPPKEQCLLCHKLAQP